MDLVPLKKSNLTGVQFEQLSDVSPEDDEQSMTVENFVALAVRKRGKR